FETDGIEAAGRGVLKLRSRLIAEADIHNYIIRSIFFLMDFPKSKKIQIIKQFSQCPSRSTNPSSIAALWNDLKKFHLQSVSSNHVAPGVLHIPYILI